MDREWLLAHSTYHHDQLTLSGWNGPTITDTQVAKKVHEPWILPQLMSGCRKGRWKKKEIELVLHAYHQTYSCFNKLLDHVVNFSLGHFAYYGTAHTERQHTVHQICIHDIINSHVVFNHFNHDLLSIQFLPYLGLEEWNKPC